MSSEIFQRAITSAPKVSVESTLTVSIISPLVPFSKSTERRLSRSAVNNDASIYKPFGKYLIPNAVNVISSPS